MFEFKLLFDVPLLLTLVTLLSGLLVLLDLIYFTKQKRNRGKLTLVFDCAKSFFPIFLSVLLIRSFLIQPYRVPTGSLEPTIMPGDFIIVNQYAYGLRLPVFNKKILSIGSPKRGDVALFRYPVDPAVIFVKRVIGLPGDRISYRNKTLTINGKVAEQTDLGVELETANGFYAPVRAKLEDLGEVTHKIYIKPNRKEFEEFELVIPEGSYFMMGDNRDNSNDSRAWGVVPEKNLIGKAFGIWMSWDHPNKKIRWQRIGKKVY